MLLALVLQLHFGIDSVAQGILCYLKNSATQFAILLATQLTSDLVLADEYVLPDLMQQWQTSVSVLRQQSSVVEKSDGRKSHVFGAKFGCRVEQMENGIVEGCLCLNDDYWFAVQLQEKRWNLSRVQLLTDAIVPSGLRNDALRPLSLQFAMIMDLWKSRGFRIVACSQHKDFVEVDFEAAFSPEKTMFSINKGRIRLLPDHGWLILAADFSTESIDFDEPSADEPSTYEIRNDYDQVDGAWRLIASKSRWGESDYGVDFKYKYLDLPDSISAPVVGPFVADSVRLTSFGFEEPPVPASSSWPSAVTLTAVGFVLCLLAAYLKKRMTA